MQLNLKPETQKFIEEQVAAGLFRTADELVEEAIRRMIIEDEAELDDETVAAIRKADEQFARGEGMNFAEFAAEMRRKIAAREPI